MIHFTVRSLQNLGMIILLSEFICYCFERILLLPPLLEMEQQYVAKAFPKLSGTDDSLASVS